jgi:hypothetical protein
MRASAALGVVLALVAAGCGGGEESSSLAPSATAATDTVAESLPGPVAETRAAILAAAEAGDYELLRPALDQEIFLSDYGFGNEQPDPVSKWQALGQTPLKAMNALLRMPVTVRDTNEGTLYEWPRFLPSQDAPAARLEDLTPSERELFGTFMSEAELAQAFNPDYGYTAPRIGILADGKWWFFVLESGP